TISAERHPNADLIRATGYRVRQDAVKTEAGKQQRQQTEAAGERREEALLAERSRDAWGQGLELKHRHGRIQRSRLTPDSSGDRGGIARRPNDQCHRSLSAHGLGKGEVEHRAPLIAETRVSDVLYHADDFNPEIMCDVPPFEAAVEGKTETPP